MPWKHANENWNQSVCLVSYIFHELLLRYFEFIVITIYLLIQITLTFLYVYIIYANNCTLLQ